MHAGRHLLQGGAGTKNPSCTSVDNLIRQRLTGVTVTSTNGPTSQGGLGSHEALPSQRPEQEREGLYSVETLKEKQTALQ